MKFSIARYICRVITVFTLIVQALLLFTVSDYTSIMNEIGKLSMTRKQVFLSNFNNNKHVF